MTPQVTACPNCGRPIVVGRGPGGVEVALEPGAPTYVVAAESIDGSTLWVSAIDGPRRLRKGGAMVAHDCAELRAAVNESCSCGGRGPDDDPCPACQVWHLLTRKVDPQAFRPPVPPPTAGPTGSAA